MFLLALQSALYDEFYGDSPPVMDRCLYVSDGAVGVAYEHIHCRKYRNEEVVVRNERVRLEGYQAPLLAQNDKRFPQWLELLIVAAALGSITAAATALGVKRRRWTE